MFNITTCCRRSRKKLCDFASDPHLIDLLPWVMHPPTITGIRDSMAVLFNRLHKLFSKLKSVEKANYIIQLFLKTNLCRYGFKRMNLSSYPILFPMLIHLHLNIFNYSFNTKTWKFIFTFIIKLEIEW